MTFNFEKDEVYRKIIVKYTNKRQLKYFEYNEITSWDLYNFLLYRFNQENFANTLLGLQTEHSIYINFLEQFRNDFKEEGDYLIKQFKVKTTLLYIYILILT
jgi:hypothetical protein